MRRIAATIIAMLVSMSAYSQTVQLSTLVHVFTNSDGAQPYAGLTASGNTLFGTAYHGGASGDGTVFSVNTDGSGFSLLHSFSGGDGSNVLADLWLAGNILYGEAGSGGAHNQGALFSITTDGVTFNTIHNFGGEPDGGEPAAGVLLSGNILYGTTSAGIGASSNGTVFAVDTNGVNFIPLHTFDGADGKAPFGDLVLGDNVLYGTTLGGGVSNLGTIFSIQTNGSSFTVLHNFTNTDGTLPRGGLVLSHGTLYGTAYSGGEYGVGSVFSVKTDGTDFTVLYSFIHTAVAASTDGEHPLAGLYLHNNVLYGTTLYGGGAGDGTVFSIMTDGSNYTQLISFGGNNIDGLYPGSPLILAGDSLYGTTVDGGSDLSGTIYGLQIQGVAFTAQPASQTNIPVGDTVSFDVAALSLSFPGTALQYQWRLNGVNIPGATTADLSFADVQPTNGGSLTVIVSDGTEVTASTAVGFSVAIQTAASGNNNFANRYAVEQGASGVVSGSNIGANRQPGEPEILAGNPGGKSIWFQWTPTVSGTAVFTTRGSYFDTIMGVYTGTAVNALTRVPSCVNDDDYGGYLTSKVSFDCTAGAAYQITVDGYWGASGNVVLSWGTVENAQPLATILLAPPRQTIAANGAAVTLFCQPNTGVPTWIFNGQETGVTATNYVIGAVGDKTVGSYIAQVTTSGGVASTEPVHVQINLLEDGTSDPNSVAWNKFLDSTSSPYSNPQPSIRKLGGGGDTRGFSVSQTFSTVGATGEPGEPSIDGQIGGAPVWYTYVTPTNGAMVVNTAGSTFNTMLAVFIGPGDSFATLINLGAGYTTNRVLDGQPQIFVTNVPAGQTNFIVVDGYGGTSGTVHLNINLGSPPGISTPPQNQFAVAGSNATFSVGVTGTTPLSYLWQFNGTNIAGATNDSLTIPDVQSANTGQYSVIASNLFGVASNSAALSLGSVPVIATQPFGHTVAPGSTATLSVTASGTPPPAYQWMLNGNRIGNNDSAISIPDFGAAYEGTYFVVVSNAVGDIASSNALLFLNTFQLSAPSRSASAFQLELTGAAGASYVLEASTNLVTWTPLITNATPSGFLLLTDTNAGNYGQRFYRGTTN
jgi:uncharacterized repeat protein (TIGR03803 family)